MPNGDFTYSKHEFLCTLITTTDLASTPVMSSDSGMLINWSTVLDGWYNINFFFNFNSIRQHIGCGIWSPCRSHIHCLIYDNTHSYSINMC